MKTVITTAACTLLVALALMAAVSFYFVMQSPSTYTCVKKSTTP